MKTLLSTLIALGALTLGSSVHCAQLRGIVQDANGKAVPNAVLVAMPEGVAVPPANAAIEVVDQIDKEFVPYVKPVRVGSLVRFPNKDNIQHHVYSFSSAKKFELPLYKGAQSEPVRFDKPGVVKLGCNVHDWMVAYVYVTDAPYFGKTVADGSIVLKDLPSGRYRVHVWHPQVEASEEELAKRVDLAGGDSLTVNWSVKLKPAFRPLRAPTPGDGGYR